MKSWNIALLFALATSSALACGGTSREGDSETHWVACKRTEDCSGAQICEAKRCVEPATEGAGGRSNNLPAGGTGGPATGTGGGPTSGTGGGPTSGTGGGPMTGTGGGPMGGSGAPGNGGSPGQAPDWSCLGEPSPPDEDLMDASVYFMLRDVLSNSPIADADAWICPRLDVDCPDLVTSAVDGRLMVPIPTGFDGYAWFTTRTTWPTAYAINRSSFRFGREVTVQLARAETVNALSGVLESPQLAGNAIALVTVRDCAGTPAKEVTFLALEYGTTQRPFYSIGGIPDKDAAMTDVSGNGGWVNVPAGPLTLEAVLTDGTARVVGRHTVFLRPDSMMVVNVAANDDE